MRPLIRDQNDILEIIKKLRKSINEGSVNASLNTGADPDKIKLFETAFGVHLPASFRVFLGEINGGFIANKEADWYWMNDGHDAAESRSTRILSIEDIIDEYETLMLDNWKLNPKLEEGLYPYIPFCITEENEKLIFIDKTTPGESGVYLAYHDEPAKDWVLIAHDFTDFYSYYFDSGGFIPLDEIDLTKRAEGIVWMQNLEWRKERANDPEEIVLRCKSYLELFPEDTVTFSKRANAYVELKEYKKALDDFNHSIAIDPDYAFPYYCRGNMFLRIKKARQALIDFDSACNLKPDDPLYLCGRAEAFYELNKMNQALADCNRAIEIDDRYELAYMNRYNIYLYLGEADKADEDAKMIDELLNEK